MYAPQTFSTIFYYLHMTYRLHFGPNLVPPKVSKNQSWEFFIHFFAPPPDPEQLQPKNSAIMIRSDAKLRTSIWYLHVWGGLSLFLVLTHPQLITHCWGRTNISISNKGRSINSLYKITHGKIYIFVKKSTQFEHF